MWECKGQWDVGSWAVPAECHRGTGIHSWEHFRSASHWCCSKGRAHILCSHRTTAPRWGCTSRSKAKSSMACRGLQTPRALHAWWSLTSIFGRCISEDFGKMYTQVRQTAGTLSSVRATTSAARSTQEKPAGKVPLSPYNSIPLAGSSPNQRDPRGLCDPHPVMCPQ